MHDARGFVGAERRHCADRADDQVDGNDVDRPFGNSWELPQQAARVRDDHWLGHAEPADPAGAGLDQRGLDDGGAHDAHWHVTLHLHQRAFAERLRVRVRVGPSERRGARSARGDELVGHPTLAERFRLGRERGCACRSELCTRLASIARQPGWITARGIGVSAGAAGRGDLAPPVDAEVERPLAHQLLRRIAATVARDVRRRHRDEMRRHAQVAKRLHDADGTEEVDLDGVVDRGVERHRRRRVDEDLTRRELCASRLVEPEPVGAHVAGDHGDPASDLLVEAFAEQLAQMVEGVVAQDLALHPLRGRRAPATAHEQHEGAIGHGSEQPFHDGGAEEPRRARDRDAAAGQCLPDHLALSTIW